MLEPGSRELLLDALRPDPGFGLDCAVATTYSLDLDALLMAPLAFALFDVDAGSADADPIALLAAVKSYAGKIALYCDAAHIAAPPRERPLFQLLEPMMRPVVQPGGAFHPKVWVLRYRESRGSDLRHRVLVLSRNLTFDRSWDTIVRLDEAGEGPANTPELTRFLRTLRSRSPSPVVSELVRTLPRVSLEVPPPFSSLRFWSVGADGEDPLGTIEGAELLVMSPFASPERLRTVASSFRRRVLVTRGETLDELGGDALAGWDETYVLHDEAVDGLDDAVLSGLHAKVYVVDDGRERRVFTGSANATTAAFGANTELLVELRSSHPSTKVSSLLSDSGPEVSLRRLLRAREPASAGPAEKTAEDRERERLESLSSSVANSSLIARAALGADTRWTVELELSLDDVQLDRADRLRARLVTAGGPWATLAVHEGVGRATVSAGAASRVSRLVAFELSSGKQLEVEPVRFVLVAELRDAPPEREDRLLLELLPDAERVMRLLFFLLADARPGNDGAEVVRGMIAGESAASSWAPELPLFENLARTFSREPQRLTTIRGVIEQLGATEDGRRRLPAGFLEVWRTFDAALGKEAGK